MWEKVQLHALIMPALGGRCQLHTPYVMLVSKGSATWMKITVLLVTARLSQSHNLKNFTFFFFAKWVTFLNNVRKTAQLNVFPRF
jgi:hypothetical protein